MPAKSASGIANEIMEDEVTEMEILEDEVDWQTMQDQRGGTKYPFKVSIGVSRRSCCECARVDLCH